MATQRVPTGIPGLDDLFCGGFLEGDAVLVAGAPGTGKSTLGMQYLYEGIQCYDETGLFITFEEFPQQIYRDALNFGWDFRRLEEEDKLKVLFTSPELMFQDIKRHEGIFPEMMREINAKRVVVDSITHFTRLAENQGELREMIYSLINALKREGLTPLLVRELVEGEMLGTSSEEYTADSVIQLTMDRIEGQRMRFAEVLKSRGSRHVPAKSFFTIGERGIAIVPPFQSAFFRYQEAISIGIPEVDNLLGGGIPYGAFYLCEISPEFHQEIFELNFIRETVRMGDQYLEISASASRIPKLLHTAQSYGMRDEIERAVADGSAQFVNAFGLEAPDEISLPDSHEDEDEEDLYAHAEESLLDAVTLIDDAFQRTSIGHRGRLMLNVTNLMAGIDDELFFAFLSPILDMLQQYGGVCLGFLNPQAIPPSAREKLLSKADGIVRIWRGGHYTFIQVAKTVNSVITPIYSLTESNSPPYVRITQ